MSDLEEELKSLRKVFMDLKKLAEVRDFDGQRDYVEKLKIEQPAIFKYLLACSSVIYGALASHILGKEKVEIEFSVVTNYTCSGKLLVENIPVADIIVNRMFDDHFKTLCHNAGIGLRVYSPTVQ